MDGEREREGEDKKEYDFESNLLQTESTSTVVYCCNVQLCS